MRIGEHLLKEGLITTEQLDQGLEYQKTHGGRLGSCLVKMGLVSREAVAKFLAGKHCVASVDLSSCKPDPDTLMLLPFDICMKYRLVPIRCDKSNGVLEVAMVDPGNRFAIDDLMFMTGLKIKPLVALEADVDAALQAVEKHMSDLAWLPPGKRGCLLVLTKSSFLGPLSEIQLIAERSEKGACRYFVACKTHFPPGVEKIFDEKPHLQELFEGRLRRETPWRPLDPIFEGELCLLDLQELPPQEADEIIKLLDSLGIRGLPRVTGGLVLDGESFGMLIERAFPIMYFHWSCDPPKGWEPLGKVAQILIARAEELSARTRLLAETDDSGPRQQLREEFSEEMSLLKKAILQAHAESERREKENFQAQRLAYQMRTTDIKCPVCGHEAKDFRFYDKRPDGWSYFVCRSCGKSFRPGDTSRSST
jgi:hypothetical protein